MQVAKREESRLRLEAAKRQREVAAERTRIEDERRKAEDNRRARESAANLDRMRAGWAETHALQQARQSFMPTLTACARPMLALMHGIFGCVNARYLLVRNGAAARQVGCACRQRSRAMRARRTRGGRRARRPQRRPSSTWRTRTRRTTRCPRGRTRASPAPVRPLPGAPCPTSPPELPMASLCNEPLRCFTEQQWSETSWQQLRCSSCMISGQCAMHQQLHCFSAACRNTRSFFMKGIRLSSTDTYT